MFRAWNLQLEKHCWLTCHCSRAYRILIVYQYHAMLSSGYVMAYNMDYEA